MKIKREAIRRMLSIACLLVAVALPLSGFQKIVSGQSTPTISSNDVTPLTNFARQLSKETASVSKKGGLDLTAYILSVHSRVEGKELLARSEGLKRLAPLAIVAKLTDQNLDQVVAATDAGTSLDDIVTKAGVNLKSAQNRMLSALMGMRINNFNIDKGLFDYDADGIPNVMDKDVDGDGIVNADDKDIDGDGAPNTIDTDIDGDGMPNGMDDDIDGDGISNNDDSDIDGDGIPNAEDDDKDGDGILNKQDGDANGNGVSDDQEPSLTTSDHGSGSGGSQVEFTANIESLPSGTFIGEWRIGGRAVQVTAATEIRGSMTVGQLVEVKGNTRADGALEATRIKTEDSAGNGNGNGNANGNGNGNTNGNANGNGGAQVEFTANIESLPSGSLIGDWRIGGRTVHVTTATEIRGTMTVGQLVEVKGTNLADGSLNAIRIKTEDAAGNGNANGNGNGNGNGNANGNGNGNGNGNANGNANGNGAQTGTFLKFKGLVQSMPQNFVGTWVINGQAVVVAQASQVNQDNGPVGNGIKVVVKGTMMPNGTFIASKVIVR